MEDNKQDQVDGNLSEDKSSMPSSKQEVFCFPRIKAPCDLLKT
jgi:hypothetical protein